MKYNLTRVLGLLMALISVPLFVDFADTLHRSQQVQRIVEQASDSKHPRDAIVLLEQAKSISRQPSEVFDLNRRIAIVYLKDGKGEHCERVLLENLKLAEDTSDVQIRKDAQSDLRWFYSQFRKLK